MLFRSSICQVVNVEKHPKGRVLGGHLLEGGGAVAVTAKVVIDALDGVSLTRAVDGETDMPIFSLGD